MYERHVFLSPTPYNSNVYLYQESYLQQYNYHNDCSVKKCIEMYSRRKYIPQIINYLMFLTEYVHKLKNKWWENISYKHSENYNVMYLK